MSSAFDCDAGLTYFNCGNEFEGCCTVDPCSLPSGCPDQANCNDSLGESSCGALCCPNATDCSYLGYSCAALKNGAAITIIPDAPTFTTSVTFKTRSTTSLKTSTSSPTTDTGAKVSADTDPTSLALPKVSSSPFSSVQPSLATQPNSRPAPATTTASSNATIASPLASPSAQGSTSHGAAIGGSVGGIAGIILAVILLRLVFSCHRRKMHIDTTTNQADDEHRIQGKDANREGAVLKKDVGTNGDVTKSVKSLILSIFRPSHRRGVKEFPSKAPTPPYAGMEEPNGNVSNPELPTEPVAHQIAELSPDAELPAINTARRASASSRTDINSNAGTVESAGVSPMSPNLDLGTNRRVSSATNATHVMSFMEYDEKTSSPVR